MKKIDVELLSFVLLLSFVFLPSLYVIYKVYDLEGICMDGLIEGLGYKKEELEVFINYRKYRPCDILRTKKIRDEFNAFLCGNDQVFFFDETTGKYWFEKRDLRGIKGLDTKYWRKCNLGPAMP